MLILFLKDVLSGVDYTVLVFIRIHYHYRLLQKTSTLVMLRVKYYYKLQDRHKELKRCKHTTNRCSRTKCVPDLKHFVMSDILQVEVVLEHMNGEISFFSICYGWPIGEKKAHIRR